MPAYCGRISPLTSALLCFLLPPRATALLYCLSLSAPLCGDTTRLKKHRDVFLHLRRPHKLGSGLPYEGQALTGGGCCQVSIGLVAEKRNACGIMTENE